MLGPSLHIVHGFENARPKVWFHVPFIVQLIHHAARIAICLGTIFGKIVHPSNKVG